MMSALIRLSESEQKKIVSSVLALEGCHPRAIYLFGSRVDPKKRGGDIDLWIELESTPMDTSVLGRVLRLSLEALLGEQKFDIVFSGPLAQIKDSQLAAFRDAVLPSKVTLWKAHS